MAVSSPPTSEKEGAAKPVQAQAQQAQTQQTPKPAPKPIFTDYASI